MTDESASTRIARRRWSSIFSLALLLLGHGWAVAAEQACVSSTPAVASMESKEIVFSGADDEVRIMVKHAETMRQRAAGMQHLCPEAIRRHPILFTFGKAMKPAFHMQNVHAPLDILFLDEAGEILEIQRMEPGGELTFPAQPVRYALELLAGESARLALHPGMRMQAPVH